MVDSKYQILIRADWENEIGKRLLSNNLQSGDGAEEGETRGKKKNT